MINQTLNLNQNIKTPTKNHETKRNGKRNASMAPIGREHGNKISDELMENLIKKLVNYSKKENKKLSKKENNFLSNYSQNKILFNKYSKCHYDYSQELDNLEKKSSTISKGKISENLRRKIVDSMFHIYQKYQSSQKSIFKCVSIFDRFIAASNKIFNNENHLKLIGMTCIFLGSKFEDPIPLGLKHLVVLTDEQFRANEFHEMEKKILNVLNFDIVEADIDDYIRYILMNIVTSNERKIKDLNLTKDFIIMEKISLFVSKMLLLEPNFVNKKMEIKAISSIILAFDIMRTHLIFGNIECEKEKYVNSKLKDFLKNSSFEQNEVENFYSLIYAYYQAKNGFSETYIGEAFNDYLESIAKI